MAELHMKNTAKHVHAFEQKKLAKQPCLLTFHVTLHKCESKAGTVASAKHKSKHEESAVESPLLTYKEMYIQKVCFKTINLIKGIANFCTKSVDLCVLCKSWIKFFR